MFFRTGNYAFFRSHLLIILTHNDCDKYKACLWRFFSSFFKRMFGRYASTRIEVKSLSITPAESGERICS